ARQVMIRAVTALFVTMLATALLQVALAMGVLSPLLARSLPADELWMPLGVPIVLALGSLVAAGLAWGSVRRSLLESARSAPTASDHSAQLEARSADSMLLSLQEERIHR